jgi:hypothetical protein
MLIIGNEFFENKKERKKAQHNSNYTQTNEVFTKRLELVEQKGELSQEIGNIFHQIMEKCDSLEKAVLELNSYQMKTKSEEAFISQYIHSIYQHEELSKWLTNKNALSERDFVKNGEIFRPDKVIFEDDKIVIVDFKTGNQSETHEKQIKSYAETIEYIEKKTAKCYLTYYSNGLIVKQV